MFQRKILRMLCAAGLVWVGSVLATDWPQWRGPNRDGLSPETGLLKAWPSGGPKLVWKSTGLGGGYSLPSIVKGRIYGMSYRGQEEVVWALEEATGQEVWHRRIAAADQGIGYSEGSRCTPAVDADRLYVLGAGGMAACLESATGKSRWQHDLAKDFGGKMMSGWGFSESPLVDGAQVLYTPGGKQGTVVAFNKLTGDVVWRCTELTDNAAYSSLIAVEIAGVRQYVVLTDASVAGIAADTGKLLWRAPRRGRTAVIPTPIYGDGCVYVTSGYDIGCNLFRITAASRSFKADPVYESKVMVNHHGGVVKVGDLLYGYSDRGGWTCQDFKSGKVVWAEKGKLGKGAIGYADGHLYLRDEKGAGTVVLIEATPKGWVETGRFDQPDRSDKNSWPHPIVVNGRLYLRDQALLLCYDVSAK